MFGKSVLIFFRTFTLILILLLLFDPTLNLTSRQTVEPENLVFIDNSKSISEFATDEQKTELRKLIKSLNNQLDGTTTFFTFGKEIKEFKKKEFDSLKYNDVSTDFYSILEKAKNKDHIASILIITDGIINEGKNPIYEVENLATPVFTIGIGDTTSESDISVKEIQNNQFIYAGRETDIEVTIANIRFSNKKVNVGLFENNQLITSQSITLSSSGVNRIRFPYSSDIGGEHKLTVKITSKQDEKNIANNAKTTIINIVETKKKITLIAGSPSPDFAAVKNSLIKNKDYDIKSIIQINNNKFYKNENNLEYISEADILFLIGFPASNSDKQLLQKIKKEVSENKKPLFICFSTNIDFASLKQMEEILPFKIQNISEKFLSIQVTPVNNISGLLGNNENVLNSWKKLPPVNISRTKILPLMSSEVLLVDNNINKRPVLFSNNTAGNKSIVLTASNIWKWKLRAIHKEYKLFDNFLLNSVKWLSIKADAEFFNVHVSKKSYKLGESIIINANLLDETYEPVNNATVIVTIKGNNEIINFTPLGNGLYKAVFKLTKPGFYNYTAKVVDENLKFKEVKGTFNIEEIELELLNGKMNKTLLQTLSEKTGGKYYDINNYEEITTRINENYQSKVTFNLVDNELRLSNFELILLFIVLLFSLEWIIRKVYRMI